MDTAQVEQAALSEVVTGVSIDSRTVMPGDVFIALSGASRHGILFADEAIARGAVCVITETTSSEFTTSGSDVIRFRSTETAETDGRIIRVRNAITALQQLAVWNRQQSSALVIGVTGSVGKTTTRQMIAAVLQREFEGVQSPRNFNNELGVPLSLLQLGPGHDFAVLEMGASRIGEIARLAELAGPEFGVVTRVAAAHLDSFGSVGDVRRAKQELVEAINGDGTVFLNADDPEVRGMRSVATAKTVLFGLSSESDIRATEIVSTNGRCRLVVNDTEFRFQGPRHLVTSPLAAIAMGRITGLSDRRIAEGLAEFRADAGRGRVVLTEPWTVIDDSYNASPASVSAAIESLRDWQSGRHRILVLGDMLELGTDSEATHFEIGRQLASSAVDHTLVYGRFAECVISGARSTGVSTNHLSLFHDQETLQVMLDCILAPGDVVLVKGSRSMQMERIVQWLQIQAMTGQSRTAA